jgi:HAD superfamily hydrolase (TIGR01509 family)
MKARRPSTRPVAVIFDMDGLMLDTESLGPQTWREAAAAIGVDFDLDLLPAMIGRNYRDCREMLRAHYGASYPVEQLTATCLTVFDEIVARQGVAQKPGLRELLDWLEGENVVRAVATSTRRDRAEAQLTHQGLLARFATLVGGNEVERGKPEPDIFLLAASRLAVAAADCVVLEDSEPGVRAALAAGMMPIMVPDLHAPSQDLLAREPLVLASLHDVRAHLAQLPR